MTFRLSEDGLAVLHGDCSSEDAEPLLGYLAARGRTVDWRECDTAHAAVVQVLMVAGVEVLGPPRGEFLRLFVEPAINAQ